MARRRSRQATEEAIVSATISLIAGVGVDGFTLSDVAKRAGVNRALIYHYFQDRDTLIDRATERAMQRSMQGRPASGLLTVAQLMEMFIRDPETCRLSLRFLTASRWPPAIRERFMLVVREAERLKVQAGMDFDSAIAVATTTLAAMAWACARENCAALLDIPVEVADRRFLASLTGDAPQKLAELLTVASERRGPFQAP